MLNPELNPELEAAILSWLDTVTKHIDELSELRIRVTVYAAKAGVSITTLAKANSVSRQTVHHWRNTEVSERPATVTEREMGRSPTWP